MTQSSVPPTSSAEYASVQTKCPTTGAKDHSTMVCLCAPVGGSKTPGPVAPAATQTPRQEYMGIVAVSYPALDQRGGLSAPQGISGMPSNPRPQPTGGEFVATSPNGQKFLCCPLPS